MKSIPKYNFHKKKYGEELLIDVVRLCDIQKYIEKDPTHTLSYFDITIIEQGNGSISIDNKSHDLVKGDVVFTRPGDVRTWNTDNLPDAYALIFEEEFLISFFNDPLFLRRLSFFDHRQASIKISILNIESRINNLIQDMIGEINIDTSKDNHILRALLYETLMLLNREYNNQNKQSADTIKISNRYVESFINLVNSDFRQSHHTHYYADKLCITPNYLNEVIKKATGINAKLYIANKILAEAKKLLAYTDMSISEIADDLGFDSHSYFIRIFRKQTNFTPLQYRIHAKR